ncbi:unnamed protein product, partial [Rotaria sp. Silwood2]
MEYNSAVSMILPDTIDLIENDFNDEDHEDIVHEQTNQNEIVELIMAAFEGQEEPSDGEDDDDDDDDDDDESCNTSDSSHHTSDEKNMLTMNNNHHYTDEHYVPENNELLDRNHSDQQTLFSTSAIFTPSSDVHKSEINDNDYTCSQNGEHNNHLSIIDPMQVQYLHKKSSTNLNETQNQLNKLRILCNAKDRKVSQLENLCEEYREKYENDVRKLKHKLELSERSKYDLEQKYQLIYTQHEILFQTNNQLHRTIKDAELRIQQLE